MITVLLLDQLTDQTITITHLLKYFNITALGNSDIQTH